MQYTTQINEVLTCSLERAFKTPMLCDIARIHTGSGITPPVTHCTEDDTWGRVGGSRKVWMARTWAFKGGESSFDKVIERRENEYWKIEVAEFKSYSMGFHAFVGEWFTKEIATGQIEVVYRYTLHTNGFLGYPFHWLFTKIIWRGYMRQVMDNIKILIKEEAPYLHQ